MREKLFRRRALLIFADNLNGVPTSVSALKNCAIHISGLFDELQVVAS